MRLPLLTVEEVYLLGTLLGAEEFDLARFARVLRSDIGKVKIDCAIKTLDLVLNEQTDLNVAVFKELVHLLTHNLPVVGIHFPAHFHKPTLSVCNILKSVGACDELLQDP